MLKIGANDVEMFVVRGLWKLLMDREKLELVIDNMHKMTSDNNNDHLLRRFAMVKMWILSDDLNCKLGMLKELRFCVWKNEDLKLCCGLDTGFC